MSDSPPMSEIADRALVLSALVRRAVLEYALAHAGDDPRRERQAETARTETDRWLNRESLTRALTQQERALFDAPSGTWPNQAVADGMWRKEALGAVLWALGHVGSMPPFAEEFEVAVLNQRIEAYGSVSSFRANGRLRTADELERAREDAMAWLAAAEGADDDVSTLASISAERARALGWVLDREAPTP